MSSFYRTHSLLYCLFVVILTSGGNAGDRLNVLVFETLYLIPPHSSVKISSFDERPCVFSALSLPLDLNMPLPVGAKA